MDKRGNQKRWEALRLLLPGRVNETILKVGDVYFPSPIGPFVIEIKGLGDFLHSISTGRMHTQAVGMSELDAARFIIVEGRMDVTSDGYLKTHWHGSKWKYESIMGIVISMFLRGICIIQTTSEYSTALVIRTMYNQANSPGQPAQVKDKILSFSKISPQLRVVCSLPHMGPVMGKDALDRFISPIGFVNAGVLEMQEIKGVSGRIAEEIRKVLDSPPPKDDNYV